MRDIFLLDRTLYVLGKGLYGNPEKNELIRVSTHSKLNVIAAGLLYQRRRIKGIVFTGGKTKGTGYISEAKAMEMCCHQEFFSIPWPVIVREDGSIDTAQNITNMLEKHFFERGDSIVVLSLSQHIQRAKILFWNIAEVNAEIVSAQEVIEKYGSEEHKRLLRKFNRSLTEGVWETIKEMVLLYLILPFDPTGKKLRYITKFLRHGN